MNQGAWATLALAAVMVGISIGSSGAAVAPQAGDDPFKSGVAVHEGGPAWPGFPVTETFAYRPGLAVVRLSFDRNDSARLVAVRIHCGARTKSFPINGIYYALWNRPVLSGSWQPNGRQLRFTLPLSTSVAAQARDHVLLVECRDRQITMTIAE